MNVIKRNGDIVKYDESKIFGAICKANSEMTKEEDRIIEYEIYSIIDSIRSCAEARESNNQDPLSVEEIQDLVEDGLLDRDYYKLAKAYIKYRHERKLARHINDLDSSILNLIDEINPELQDENSNKNPHVIYTQRDLIAGETSKYIANKFLLPKFVTENHKKGVFHFHDMDYYMHPSFNCCLVDIRDMLDNGTIINGKMIETPKSFQVACNVMTQIITNVSSSQYGGVSVDIGALGKYLRRSSDKFKKKIEEAMPTASYTNKASMHHSMLKSELEAGVQTIQYQINTMATTNGQTPFVTLFMYLKEDDEFLEENAMVFEEVLKQRILGIKNKVGVYVAPSFPKLVYVLSPLNNLSGGKYDYITRIAVKCVSKRMMPDFISEKVMKECYEGNVFSPMGCRSFLSPWKDENGNYKFDGRFNCGVVSINLPQIGIIANRDMDKFWKLFDERLDLCRDALLVRHKHLRGVKSNVSPIHWQNGAICRMKEGETIDHMLFGGYSTLSLGYIGLYEVTKAMTGLSHTDPNGGEQFAVAVMKHLREKVNQWKEEYNIGFALYGTPAESLCYKFARIDKEQFGEIEDITDKGYYTNSYHVDVREQITGFDKIKFEAQFQKLSSGGCISYVEVPNMSDNLEALEAFIPYIYENIQYCEFNTKSDYCMECGFDGEIKLNDKLEWECPRCGNTDRNRMNVCRRTCGLNPRWSTLNQLNCGNSLRALEATT